MVTELKIENNKSPQNIKVCFDPGHGGKDTHNTSPDGQYNEAYSMLALGKVILKEAQKRGHGDKVFLTRTADLTLSLTERVSLAVNNRGTHLISLHSNAGKGTGPECYYSLTREQDKALAQELSSAIAREFNLKDRGAKVRESTKHPGQDYYTVINKGAQSKLPTYILEVMFHDREKPDLVYLQDNQESTFLRLARTILDTLGLTSPRENTSGPTLGQGQGQGQETLTEITQILGDIRTSLQHIEQSLT